MIVVVLAATNMSLAPVIPRLHDAGTCRRSSTPPNAWPSHAPGLGAGGTDVIAFPGVYLGLFGADFKQVRPRS